MTQSQKDIFLNGGEGDRYFQRNNSKYLADAAEDMPRHLRFFNQFIREGDKVLEIGCATGINLQRLRNLTRCEGYGVDPSGDAITKGRAAFPELVLEVGTADELPYSQGDFDFVLFGFCLYVVDRVLLPKVVSEADRVLKNKGFLGITDFDAILPVMRPYRHVPGMFSYKMDYSRLFTAYPHYSLVEKINYSHSSEEFCEIPQERIASSVLFKDHSNAYISQPE